MWGDPFEEHRLDLNSEHEKQQLAAFLEKQGLALDREIEYSMVLTRQGKIAATGSFSNKVLKCIAVDEEYKSLGLSSRVVTHLVNEEYKRGRPHLFVFTKPENESIFSELGMYTVGKVPSRVVLMENRRDGIEKYLDRISEAAGKITASAAVVVNCNPFTLGHRHLLEYAASRCQKLHVFVVWEDRSCFPAEVRYRLVREGVSHLPNVVVHEGRDYIISDATFPSYFIKTYDAMAEVHARLDITIFLQHIAKRLEIKKRYVGEEPFDAVTSAYNRVMGEMLPAAGLELEVIPRLASGDVAISASRVREAIRAGRIEEVRALVPENTYRFLISSEAEEVIRRIRSSSGRH